MIQTLRVILSVAHTMAAGRGSAERIEEVVRSVEIPASKRHGRTLVLGLVAATIYAMGTLLQRDIATEVSAAVVVFWRAFGGFVGIGLLMMWRRLRIGLPSTLTVTRGAVATLIGVPLISQVGGNWYFQRSLECCGVTIAGTISLSLTVVVGALLCARYLGERLSMSTWLQVAMVTASVACCSAGAYGSGFHAGGHRIVVGVLFAIVAGTSHGIATTIIRGMRHQIPARAFVFTISTAGVVIFGITVSMNAGVGALVGYSAEIQGKLAAIGVCNLLAFSLFAVTLQETAKAVHGNTTNATQAAIVCLAGVLLFREPVNIVVMIGAVFALVSLLLMDQGVDPTPGEGDLTATYRGRMQRAECPVAGRTETNQQDRADRPE